MTKLDPDWVRLNIFVGYPSNSLDEFLILACDAAVNTFQMLFPSKKIIPGLNTIGYGARDAQGNIFIIKDLKNK